MKVLVLGCNRWNRTADRPVPPWRLVSLISAHVAVDFGQCWELLTFDLADVKKIDGPGIRAPSADLHLLRLHFARRSLEIPR